MERKLQIKSRHSPGARTPTEDVHRSRHSSGRTDAQEVSLVRFSFHDYIWRKATGEWYVCLGWRRSLSPTMASLEKAWVLVLYLDMFDNTNVGYLPRECTVIFFANSIYVSFLYTWQCGTYTDMEMKCYICSILTAFRHYLGHLTKTTTLVIYLFKTLIKSIFPLNMIFHTK